MKRSILGGSAATALLLALAAPVRAQAPAEGPFNPATTVRDNLQRLQSGAKTVELLLKNGKSYKGKLASVGDHAVVVTQIEGREFFDALVLTDEIAAVEVRARDR
jgi:hypothetical protein